MPYEMPEKLLRFGEDIDQGQLKYHNRRVTVTKEFTFDAAHHLYAYEGKCNGLHGHTYRLSVSVSAFLDETGIAIDFVELKRLVNECIIKRLDHQYLNAVLPSMNTTAENMVVWIYEEIAKELSRLNPAYRLLRLKLFETPTSSVEIGWEEMQS